jgi:predicted Zn-dependent peptidase
MMAVQATCAPETAVLVARAMQDELARLTTEPPTMAEVERAKAYLTSSYVLGHQRNVEVAHYMGLFEVLLPGRPDGDLPALLASVDPAQVAQAGSLLGLRSVWVQVGGARPE